MGFLSKVFKGVKKIFKGVKKVASKVWKGVKKFAKSKVGKILITAAAIYFGGQALGMWGESAAAATTELAATTIPEVASTGVAETLGSTTIATAPETAAVLEGATIAAPTTQASTGLVTQATKAGGAALDWMAANPTATMVGGQMLTSAFTPSAAEIDAEIDAQRRAGSNIAGVDYTGGGSPISLGLVRQAQQQDLQSPTYTYKLGGSRG